MAQWVKIWLETQVQSDTGDSGSVPGSGRSGGGNGNPLHYSHLGNSRDRGAWRPTVHEVTKSQTWLSTRHTLYEYNIKNCGCSVAKSCPTLCDPMDCSTPGSSVLHSQSLLNFMSTELVMPSNHFILCHPVSFCLQYFPASGSFPVSHLFISSGQSIVSSTSASVLPMNIQGWFSLGLTGLISLPSRGLSRL